MENNWLFATQMLESMISNLVPAEQASMSQMQFMMLRMPSCYLVSPQWEVS